MDPSDGILGGGAEDPRRQGAASAGFVLDKVNVLGLVKKIIDKGFNVRLPTEKIKPMAVPVGIEPTMEVRGPAGRAGDQDQATSPSPSTMIWLGAHVSAATGEEAVAKRALKLR